MNVTKELLENIAGVHGDSFYLLDCADFVSSYESLLREFQRFYQHTNIAYSYKTNYIPRLCNIVDSLGGYAETVSEMEVEVALAVGVDSKKIFFNGPYKKRLGIERLLLSGGTVNIDSSADLLIIMNLAEQNPNSTLNVGVRCNFSIDDGVVSRFGFDVDNGDFESAVEKISAFSNINLIGLHCHFASRNLKAWRNAASGMIKIIEKYFGGASSSLRYVSLGGGLYGPMSDDLRERLDVSPPSFRDYATAAAKPFADFYGSASANDVPELLIEPGTALAANALQFAARVISIKTVAGKAIATLAGSTFNVTPGSNKISLPINVHNMSSFDSIETHEDLDMAGYTCIEGDYLYRNYCGPLSVGDFVVFESAGSYSVVMKPPFILPNVPILEIRDDGTCDVVKRQETFQDVFQTFSMDF